MVPWFYRLCQTLLYIIFKTWNRFSVIGLENLPKEPQGFILASNHVSYLDPPVLGGGITRPLVFVANQKLFKIRFLRTVITMLGALPVAADDDFRSLRTITKALKGGSGVVIFPEGTRSTGADMLEPQLGVAFLAKAAKVPIIPCYLHGTADAWPPNRKCFRPRRIQVLLGKPINVIVAKNLNRDEIYLKTAQSVMDQIHKLKSGLKS